jgi:hypothetical protein
MYKVIGADGKEYGPVPAEVLLRWVAEGRANAQTRVLPPGSSAWKTLGELGEFASAFAPAPAPIAPPTPAQSARRSSTYNLAVAGFVLSLLSLTFGLCCFGLPFNLAGLACSIAALSQMKNDPDQSGRGMAVAGLVLSIVSLLGGTIWGVLSSFHPPQFWHRVYRL